MLNSADAVVLLRVLGPVEETEALYIIKVKKKKKRRRKRKKEEVTETNKETSREGQRGSAVGGELLSVSVGDVCLWWSPGLGWGTSTVHHAPCAGGFKG